MTNSHTRLTLVSTALILIFLSQLVAPNSAQETQAPVLVCKAATLRARRPLPTIRYRCKPGVNDYDDSILKWTPRVAAMRGAAAQLATFTDPSWWQTPVDDLNACDFKKRVGKLTPADVQKFKEEYSLRLLGDSSVRMVMVSDPCYQSGYGGSDVFLLSRTSGKVSVTKALEGYYSRVDNSLGLDSADLDGEKIIELQTGNSMPPSLLNYYFSVDARTNKILPRKLFVDGTATSNQIGSDMLMSDPEDLGLPKDAVELNVIRDHKLAPSFSVYTADDQGKIESEGKHFKRTVYRWNGQVYVPE